MKQLIAAGLAAVLLAPVAAAAQYDPAPDQNTVRTLGERIDGDVAQGILPSDRAALMRAEIAAAQKAIGNGDSQATAMLADIDRDLAPYDKTVGAAEANRDLLYHAGDTITVAMRDGKTWQVEAIQNRDTLDLKQAGVMYAVGVQGAYLAKQPGYAAITLLDPASGRRVKFRFTIIDNVTD